MQPNDTTTGGAERLSEAERHVRDSITGKTHNAFASVWGRSLATLIDEIDAERAKVAEMEAAHAKTREWAEKAKDVLDFIESTFPNEKRPTNLDPEAAEFFKRWDRLIAAREAAEVGKADARIPPRPPSTLADDATEFAQRIHKGNGPYPVTVGVGANEIHVYWRTEADHKKAGHATRYGRWAVLHHVTGEFKAAKGANP